MSNTPRIGMPEITENQASKYLTHNAALRISDALMQCVVKSMALTEPPGSPSEGDVYVPAAESTGEWFDKDLKIAFYSGGGWQFVTPQDGWSVYNLNDSSAYRFVVADWEKGGSGGGASKFTDLTDAPASSLTGYGSQIVGVKASESGLQFFDNAYELEFAWEGLLPEGAVVKRVAFSRKVTFGANFVLVAFGAYVAYGCAGTAGTATKVFSIKKNGTEVGTITFPSGNHYATFASTGGSVVTFSGGDLLTVVSPDDQDATLADVAVSIPGRRLEVVIEF